MLGARRVSNSLLPPLIQTLKRSFNVPCKIRLQRGSRPYALYHCCLVGQAAFHPATTGLYRSLCRNAPPKNHREAFTHGIRAGELDEQRPQRTSSSGAGDYYADGGASAIRGRPGFLAAQT